MQGGVHPDIFILYIQVVGGREPEVLVHACRPAVAEYAAVIGKSL